MHKVKQKGVKHMYIYIDDTKIIVENISQG